MKDLDKKVAELQGKLVQVFPSKWIGTLVKSFKQSLENGSSWDVLEIENAEGSHYIIVDQKTDIKGVV